MKIIAYCYTNPLLESPPDIKIWGFEVDQLYQDLGERTAFQKLLTDCTTHSPNYLLIRRIEELGDSLTEICDRTSQLEALGIKIIIIEQAYSSFSNEIAQLLQNIQQNQHSSRLRSGHAKNRLRALPPPGKAPYGYRRGKERYILDRSTAPVVKDFFERFLLFGSLRGAVRYLEKRYGKKISVSTGKNWLTNPVYRGDLAYQNHQIIPDTHAPILSREEAAQIDRLLRSNSKLPPKTSSAPRSLGGLVTCQQCQSAMTITRVTTRGKNTEYLYLRPMNCMLQPKCKAISYQAVLEETINRICEDLPKTVAPLNLPNVYGIKLKICQDIEQKNNILQQLPILQEQGILDEETASLRSYKIRTEIAQLQEKLDQLPPDDLKVIVKAVSLRQFWLDLSESERRFYFREFIRNIEIIRGDGKEWTLRLVFIF
ncbi:recombinase family protein [Aphanothece hegewaldii CCALA 016]|uniref:Recombinase family protein n=1 Tax=Aphanothece hegewaldii CCALA 016 TaxID=2107694 RepID=A0A2T1LZK4_9CHRO|nr:recombinase family protein [Aphanothece hegewaldii]PSF37854.1 recombinase family protein [Aphanothece hegewaldii CCALA 016]